MKTLAERFWSKVRKCGIDGCWEWTASIVRGYGRLGALPAHRVSWELHHGPIPQGLCVCHRCDNRRCVRPDHLFLGTQADNMHDMLAKGRHRVLHGEDNPLAKLSARDVVAIRERRRAGESLRSLARRFGVSVRAITGVLRGETWRHVPIVPTANEQGQFLLPGVA